jgi:cytochrome c oxidase cbb3-type subunit III
VVIVLLTCNSYFANSQSKDRDTWEEDFQKSLPSGRRIFTSRCAPCHGLDGRGGKSAPNIARSAKLERRSDADLSAIVSNGIPGTGMPAFRSIGATNLQAVVNYLRVLQGQNKARVLPGDSIRGKAVFFAKGNCSSCHTVRGEGGFAGPDLTTYGADHSAAEIAAAITRARDGANLSFRIATATTHDGQQFHGSIRNEDNFSIQLQAADGSFHLLSKSDLSKLEYEPRSTMPADYEKRLSRDELNDLVSYLMTISGTENTSPASR